MRRRFLHLHLLAVSIACFSAVPGNAADRSRAVELSALDAPPERLSFEHVAITDELKQLGLDDNVTMIAIVGLDGHVQSVEDVKAAHAKTAAAARAAVLQWVFSHGRSGGEPVAFRVPVTVPIRPQQTSDTTAPLMVGEVKTTTMAPVAEAIYETIPVYPEALKGAPVDGSALVNLLVDESGKPSDPVVEFATRPEFAAPAVEAVKEWLFAPATNRSKPFAARTIVPVAFPAASASWTDEERVLQGQLHYARGYDVAPEQTVSAPFVYPYDKLIAGERGGVTLNLLVDPRGAVAQTAQGPGADPDFFLAASASLASWKFKPATKAGLPVFGVLMLQFQFDEHAEEFGYDESTFELLEALRAGTATILTLKQVDTMPRPVAQVVPVLPPGYDGERVGEAMIEFIVDRSGRVQLPRIVRATTPEIGWAAATAVAQWRFEPARKGGEVVNVKARVPIKFNAPAGPATASPGGAE